MSEEPIEHGEPKAPSNLATGLIKAIRPRQWVKNVLVVVAPLAAGRDQLEFVKFGNVGIAFIAFCVTIVWLRVFARPRALEGKYVLGGGCGLPARAAAGGTTICGGAFAAEPDA